MRLAICIGAMAAASTVVAGALAQEPTGAAHSDGAHLGLGAGIGLITPALLGDELQIFTPANGSIQIPIDIAGVLRLEPEVGFFHYATDHENDHNDSITGVRPGLGAFGMIGLSPDAIVLVGGRFSPQFVSGESESRISPTPGAPEQVVTYERSRVDFVLSPAVGGEYFLSEHFSLGAETQLSFVFVGDETVDQTPSSPYETTDDDDTAFYTFSNAVVFARVFFF